MKPQKTLTKVLRFSGREVPCVIKKSPTARRFYIFVRRDGKIVGVIPRGGKLEQIESFIERKTSWIEKALYRVEHDVPGILESSSKEEFLKKKDRALELVRDRIRHFNDFYNFKFSRAAVKIQKKRWGSCSRQGSLNFNYKIGELSDRLADYLVVHELCHLKEMNHSARFWDLVKKTIPDYRELRRELRKI
ncbi:MAG: M48 family metallopeptidase [Patescibacteria group bacterium]|jgi:hypothetical protein